jgi:hypothetical protein
VNVSQPFKTLCPNERVSNASSWRPGFVQAEDEVMRDFRDAKAMAHTLRASLANRGFKITISQSLELIADAFGVADWNTLSAAIRAAETPRKSASPPLPPTPGRPDVLPRDNASPPQPATTEGVPQVQFSAELESTLRRALAYGDQRKHQYATLEHLLLALTDDADASAVMAAYYVDLGALRNHLTGYLDNELKRLVVDDGGDSKPTAAFQRVKHRAVLQAQRLNRPLVSGAEILVAIFAERLSFAAQLLNEQAMTVHDAVNFVVHGIAKGNGVEAV